MPQTGMDDVELVNNPQTADVADVAAVAVDGDEADQKTMSLAAAFLQHSSFCTFLLGGFQVSGREY